MIFERLKKGRFFAFLLFFAVLHKESATVLCQLLSLYFDKNHSMIISLDNLVSRALPLQFSRASRSSCPVAGDLEGQGAPGTRIISRDDKKGALGTSLFFDLNDSGCKDKDTTYPELLHT